LYLKTVLVPLKRNKQEAIILNNIENYNKARLEIESRFLGLRHEHTTLIKSLITRADPDTGIVENISYRDLSIILAVDHAPGRKGAGIPQKQTIRSYLRTIAESCAAEFKIISQGQKLKCQFLNLPKIYAHFFDPKEAYTEEEGEQGIANHHENNEQFTDEEIFLGVNETTEAPISDKKSSAIKNKYINKINNNNNNKKAIAKNFKPDAETISKAISLGYTNATDPKELEAFIAYNQATGSQFADYNPIFLRWLAKSIERQQQKLAQATKQYSGRAIHGNRNVNNKINQMSARERVIKAHANKFELCEKTNRFTTKAGGYGQFNSHSMAAAY